jgi:hypothetical protein
MEIVNKTLDDCGWRRWLVSEMAVNEKFGSVTWIDEKSGREASAFGCEKILYRFEFENEFWKWTVNFEENEDCVPGILAIRSLIYKPNPNEIEKTIYYGDLLCQNTGLGRKNGFLALVNSSSLDDYFNTRLFLVEKLENELRKFYNIKVPFPLRTKFNWNLNSHDADYLIEIYDKETQEHLAVLIPLVDEWNNNWNDEKKNEYEEGKEGEKEEKEEGEERNGEYRIYVFPPVEAILRKDKGKTVERTYWNWDVNCRNLHIYWSSIHYYSSELSSPDLHFFLSNSISEIHEYARNKLASSPCP